jgi:hypothetical protein
MKLLLILCLTILNFGAFAGTIGHDIPVKKSKIIPTKSLITFYTVSMQAADYEVADYLEAIQTVLEIDIKVEEAQSENAFYFDLEMKMDTIEFEAAEYK